MRSGRDRAILIKRRRRLRQSCHFTSCHPAFFAISAMNSPAAIPFLLLIITTNLPPHHTALRCGAPLSSPSRTQRCFSPSRVSVLSRRVPLQRASLFSLLKSLATDLGAFPSVARLSLLLASLATVLSRRVSLRRALLILLPASLATVFSRRVSLRRTSLFYCWLLWLQSSLGVFLSVACRSFSLLPLAFKLK